MNVPMVDCGRTQLWLVTWCRMDVSLVISSQGCTRLSTQGWMYVSLVAGTPIRATLSMESRVDMWPFVCARSPRQRRDIEMAVLNFPWAKHTRTGRLRETLVSKVILAREVSGASSVTVSWMKK